MGSVDLDVSRETLQKLEAYRDLILKWTGKINLISKPSQEDVWERHIVDSAQVFAHAPASGHWVDLGSGGGLPIIVASIMSQGVGADHRFTMVESDQRKAVFLRTALRELSLEGTVISDRIEKIATLEADILSARALADLPTLLGFASVHMKKDGTALFPKGEGWRKEEKLAQNHWSYNCEPISSTTHNQAVVLRIKDISRV